MKRIVITLFMIVLFGTASAQQSPNYALAERFTPTKIKKMVFDKSVAPQWLKKGDLFWYSFQTPKSTKWYLVDPAKRSKRELFDNAELARQLTILTKTPFDAEHLPIENIRFNDEVTKLTFEVKNTFYRENTKDTVKGKRDSEKGDVFYFSYDLASRHIARLKNYNAPKMSPKWASVSPDGKTVVFARSNNLYYMDRANYNKALIDEKDSTIVETAITTDGVEDYGYGESNDYKDNVTIEKEKKDRKPSYVVWSPDSKHFALVRYDSRLTRKLWIINPLASPRPTLEAYSYLMPGEDRATQEHLFVFDNATKKGHQVDVSLFKDQTTYINTVDKLKRNSQDTIQPTIWRGDNSTIYLTRTSRDIKRIDIAKIDIPTLKTTSIVRDSMNVSIETRDIRVLGSGKEVIVWSERDGWGHFYLYGSDGKLKNQITKGEIHVEDIAGIDEASRVLYFIANGGIKGQNPYYEHLWRVNFDGTGMKCLNEGNFDNITKMGDTNRFFVSSYSRVNTIPTSALYDNFGKKLMELEKADLSLLFEAGYKFPEPFTVKAADGITDLYGVMYKPFDFDSTKVYPIIEYVYPGPQTEAVNAYFSSSMTRVDELAQLGFIVITVGNRGGSPQRSKWYHTYGYGNLRDYGLADKKRAIEILAARHKFIDISRVGIHGHSGGGFMSTAAMLKYPDFFKVAVSCAGNHDNNIYNNWWSEKHHGVREEVSDKGDTTFVYDISTNPEIAKNLKGKLMLVHGVVDDNVHIANTYRVAEALINAQKRFEIVILPSENHGFAGKDNYFFWRMADFFTQNLMGESHRDSTHIPELSE
ncbi:MAG: DPP IV N-terminal domain-containing protein [Rikenellaceae bacterium]